MAHMDLFFEECEIFVTTTVLDSHDELVVMYPMTAPDNIRSLASRSNVSILYSVDGTALKNVPLIFGEPSTVIIFNFPYCSSRWKCKDRTFKLPLRYLYDT